MQSTTSNWYDRYCRSRMMRALEQLESKEERYAVYLEYRLFAEAIDVAADLKDQERLVELRQVPSPINPSQSTLFDFFFPFL